MDPCDSRFFPGYPKSPFTVLACLQQILFPGTIMPEIIWMMMPARRVSNNQMSGNLHTILL